MLKGILSSASGKKRIFLALAIALALVALPAAVLAAKAGTPFTAGGFVYLNNPGHVEIHPQGATGQVRQNTNGEQIQGGVQVFGWPGLEGQTLLVNVDHDSNVLYDLTVQPGLWSIAEGKAHEKVELYLGTEKVFDGKSKASISGWFDQSVFAPVTCTDADNASYVLKGQITDNGVITLQGRGSFKGQSADGNWTANLEARCISYPFPILGGDVVITGLRFAKD